MSPEIEQLLQAWLDGELPAGERARVEAILAADAEAPAYVDSLRSISDRVRSADLPLPDAMAQARWLAQWQIARDRSVRRLAGWMTAAAAIVLAATLSTAFTHPAQAQTPALAEWESAAVGSADDDEAPRTARLIAVDLALPGHADEVSK